MKKKGAFKAMSSKVMKEQQRRLKIKQQVKRLREAAEARRRKQAGRIDLSKWSEKR